MASMADNFPELRELQTGKERRMRVFVLPIVLLTLPGLVLGQTRRAASPKTSAATTGSIEGDIYLLTQSGDTKKGAGRTVHLIYESDSLKQRLAEPCETYRAENLKRSSQKEDLSGKSAEELRALLAFHLNESEQRRQKVADEVRKALLASSVAQAGSGMNAHYKFDAVPPGRYGLWSEMQLGENLYAWWALVTVENGKTSLRDLDNSVEVSEELYCGKPLRMPPGL